MGEFSKRVSHSLWQTHPLRAHTDESENVLGGFQDVERQVYRC